MILRNEYHYPDAVMKAVQGGLYKPQPKVLRVTELIDSPLIKRLLIDFWDRLEIDIDEFVNTSFFGTALHKYLASFESEDAMIEKRWSIREDGFIITGATDIYKPDKGFIEDIKTQSAWAFVFGNRNWEQQLNCYAYLVRKNGFPVNRLFIHSFLRDWSKYEAMKGRNKDYPKCRFHKMSVPLWAGERAKEFIRERLSLHRDHKDYVCSPEERWERPTTYALLKKGRKSAVRVLNTEAEMNKYIKEKNLTSALESGTIWVEERKGRCVRCEDYCIVRSVCPYK